MYDLLPVSWVACKWYLWPKVYDLLLVSWLQVVPQREGVRSLAGVLSRHTTFLGVSSGAQVPRCPTGATVPTYCQCRAPML